MTDRRTLMFAVAASIAGCFAVVLLPREVGHAWLAALFFCSGVPVGSIGLLLVTRLVGGAWRDRLGPAMMQGAASLPVMALAAFPLLLGMAVLYPWVDHAPEGFRGAWLQPWAFVMRTSVWLAGLAAILVALRRWPAGAGAVASAGLLFLIPAGSLIAVDWLMSLDPEFHSSGFGLQALAVQFTVALMVAAVRSVRQAPDPSGTTGGLMLTLLMLWVYFAYLPFFIIWSGNVPAGAAWYLHRAGEGWGWVAGLAVLLHAVPLAALLSGTVRRSGTGLLVCAAASLAGDALQAAWIVLPVDGAPDWLSLCAFALSLLAIGVPTMLSGGHR